ncbi:MAG: response regulator [Desulfobacteraceae bacterium]|nr:response regulator [Desulfobacteraceae bacterium]
MNQPPEPMGVLVVDDEPRIRDGLNRVLKPMGYRVFTAARGREALELMAQQNVAIVVLDLQLPDVSGMEVLRAIKQDYPRVVVIIITGFGTVQTAAEAMRNGAYDLLPKPFEPDQLRIAIHRAREKMQLEKEAERLQQEKLQTLADLFLEKSRLHTIVNALPIGVMVTDHQGQAVLINPTFKRYMALPEDMAEGQALALYINDEALRSLIMEFSQGCHMGPEDSPTYEFSIGPDKFLFARGRPVLGESGECLGAVVTIVDITAMKVLDRLKREFVAKVSHELRSPLSTIHEQLAVVLSDLVGQVSPADEHLLSRAKEKTQGLIALIGDLLDLSRIESGAFSEAPKFVHMDELLENIIAFLGTRAASKHQSITLQRPAGALPPLKADPLALESIFGNLITNAINYTPDQGRIEIHLRTNETHLEVQVRDNGLGIDARHMEKIFERFYRVKNEHTRYITGTGLGLPIVKGLVEAMGGSIGVQSQPGQGSTFTVRLPLAADSNSLGGKTEG